MVLVTCDFSFLEYTHTIRIHICICTHMHIMYIHIITYIYSITFIHIPCAPNLELHLFFPSSQESVSIQCNYLCRTHGNDWGPAFWCCLHIGLDFMSSSARLLTLLCECPWRPPPWLTLLHFVLGCGGLAHHHVTVACFYSFADSWVVMLRKCASRVWPLTGSCLNEIRRQAGVLLTPHCVHYWPYWVIFSFCNET